MDALQPTPTSILIRPGFTRQLILVGNRLPGKEVVFGRFGSHPVHEMNPAIVAVEAAGIVKSLHEHRFGSNAVRQQANSDATVIYRAGPHRHFEAAAATRVLQFLEYEWSRSLLARMKADASWPARLK